MASDPDLKDIDAVTSELRNVRAQQQKVVKLATGSLNQGIINENVAQTTTALQVILFFKYILHICNFRFLSIWVLLMLLFKTQLKLTSMNVENV